jgi:hypothetical protein
MKLQNLQIFSFRHEMLHYLCGICSVGRARRLARGKLMMRSPLQAKQNRFAFVTIRYRIQYVQSGELKATVSTHL